MSLTLNDEQERALREFAARWLSKSTIHAGDEVVSRKSACALYDAVAPLMKPWRVERSEGQWVWIVTDDRKSAVVHSCNADVAQRICDLLNESEARR